MAERPPTFEWWHWWKLAKISAVFLQLAMVVWKWQKTDHQPFSGDFVGKRQKFLPFSNNHNQLFENGRKQTINNFVGTLLENGRNFGRFPTTGFRPFSNNPKCFGRFPTKRFRPFSYNFFRPFSTSPIRHVQKRLGWWWYSENLFSFLPLQPALLHHQVLKYWGEKIDLQTDLEITKKTWRSSRECFSCNALNEIDSFWIKYFFPEKVRR